MAAIAQIGQLAAIFGGGGGRWPLCWIRNLHKNLPRSLKSGSLQRFSEVETATGRKTALFTYDHRVFRPR